MNNSNFHTTGIFMNALPTSAQRYRSKSEKKYFEDLFSSVLLQLKKYNTPKKSKLKNFGVFQILKLRISMEKILSISLNP